MTAKESVKKNMVLITCAFVLCLVVSFFITSAPVYAEGTVIGQAAAGEGGSLSGNAAGDQSGHEVATSAYKGGKWVYVFRAKDPALAKQLAENMKAACATIT